MPAFMGLTKDQINYIYMIQNLGVSVIEKNKEVKGDGNETGL